MAQLPTSDDLLRRKADELEELERPRLRRLAAERDLLAARAQCWELLEEFVERARELEIEPLTWRPAPLDGHTPRVTWIVGYPLSNGAVVSASPLKYCIAERRRVRRPLLEEQEVAEIMLFTAQIGRDGHPDGTLAPQTRAGGGWPQIARLEHASTIITALRTTLETSLLALMNQRSTAP